MAMGQSDILVVQFPPLNPEHPGLMPGQSSREPFVESRQQFTCQIKV